MLHPDVRKLTSSVHGCGLVATRLLLEGTVVCAPAEGEERLVLTHRQLRALPKRLHHLAYRHRDRYVLCLDGSQYMNHSCDPNLVWVGDDTLVAVRDIAAWEEVTYDYSTSEVHLWWRPKWTCACGAACCRRIISGRDCLDAAFQERYRGHLPSWVLQFIHRNRGWRGHAGAALAWFAECVRSVQGGVWGAQARNDARTRPEPLARPDRTESAH